MEGMGDSRTNGNTVEEPRATSEDRKKCQSELEKMKNWMISCKTVKGKVMMS